MKKGRIFVLSAPSGCGKTTVCESVLKKIRNLESSVSMTTRSPRRGEKSRKDYHYVSKLFFKKQIKKGNLLEWEDNFGELYGTPKRFVLGSIKKGKNVLLSIDVKGAFKVKKALPETVLIFLKPPSIKELSRRLKGRNTDESESIKKRLKIAKKELKFAHKYDFVVVNKKFEKAVKEIILIIKKEGN